MAKKISVPRKSPMERQWEIEDAVRTLQRAETIRSDKKLMGEVKKSMNKLQNIVMGPEVAVPKAKAKPKITFKPKLKFK
ncbi:MAG: hypothetical protein RLZZ196_1107 [Bacteroidota bacterium]|jgi:hypothetical protein